MDALKKFFPFTAKPKDVTSLVVAIVIYVVVMVVAGIVLGLLGQIPLVGIITWIVGILVEIYCIGGIVLSVLDFLEIKF